MKFLRRHSMLIGVAVACAAAGAGVSAIANAGATAGTAAQPKRAHALGRHLGGRRLLFRAVHGDIVVATKTGFGTVTFDRGSVQSISGQQLTLKVGTKRATYKTITVTIPSSARVRDDGHLGSLADVKPNQRAIVIQAPARTYVIARTPR